MSFRYFSKSRNFVLYREKMIKLGKSARSLGPILSNELNSFYNVRFIQPVVLIESVITWLNTVQKLRLRACLADSSHQLI